MSKELAGLPRLSLTYARRHFEKTHDAVARGETSPLTANSNYYWSLGKRYVEVLERIDGVSAEREPVVQEYLEARGSRPTEEWVAESNLKALRRATSAKRLISEYDKRLEPLDYHKSQLEELYGLISAAWPVNLGTLVANEKEGRAYAQSRSHRAIGKRELKGWVDTDGTEFFLNRAREESPELQRKLRARELLIGGDHSLHPAILRALTAGISIEDVSFYSRISIDEIEARLRSDSGQVTSSSS